MQSLALFEGGQGFEVHVAHEVKNFLHRDTAAPRKAVLISGGVENEQAAIAGHELVAVALKRGLKRLSVFALLAKLGHFRRYVARIEAVLLVAVHFIFLGSTWRARRSRLAVIRSDNLLQSKLPLDLAGNRMVLPGVLAVGNRSHILKVDPAIDEMRVLAPVLGVHHHEVRLALQTVLLLGDLPG